MANKIEIKEKVKNFKKIITVGSDKSISIRCVLLASQAIGKSRIYNLLESEDVFDALKAIKKLGIEFKKRKNFYEIEGFGLDGYNTKKNITIDAGNSGTLARLILGLLVNSKNVVTLKGDKSLSKRDFSRVVEPLKLFGANISYKNSFLPVHISGSNYLRPIKYSENLGSAQCKSAVMLASLKTPGITQIKAKKSRDHTELLFKNLGIPIKIIKKKIYDFINIKGPFNFEGFDYKVPGDISSSSFFIVLTLLSQNSSLIIKNVNINKTRIGIIKILNKMNANIRFKNKKKYKGEFLGDISVKSKKNLKSIICPKKFNSAAIDEFLIIFLVAAKAKGNSVFRDLGELNKKESPRLDIAIKILRQIGVKILRNKNDIKIFGNPKLELMGSYTIKNFRKDHRVLMMSCVAALTLGGNWTIHDSNSSNTSFPDFFEKIKKLGGVIN